MIKIAKHVYTFASLLILVGCVPPYPETVETMEQFLNSKIGTEYPKGDLNYDKPINENSDFIELERKRKDGCSYALLVNKKSNIIEKWRFTSDHRLCKYYNPSRV